MRAAQVLTLVLLCAVDAAAQIRFESSPYLEPVPDHGACDVVVTPSNYATTLAQYSANPHVNDPNRRVFCVEPGDYRGRGEVLLLTSGTAQRPRFLRFHAQDGVANAAQRSQRALFERINVSASWWVIQGLTILPRDPDTAAYLLVNGGDHNLIDGNVVDGAAHPNVRGVPAVAVKASTSGDPATHNTVQRNLIRNGNQRRLDVDYFGVLIGRGAVAGANNDGNYVLDNEIADWGDGVAVGSNTDECATPAVQHGTVIDGNDIYLTGAKRVDCASGAADPDGDCACAENGIDVKGDPGSSAGVWTRITRNRVWGYRPTSTAAACGGSGSTGQAISSGNQCAAHVLVARNVVMDSTVGIGFGGSDWIVAGNLVQGIRSADGTGVTSLAIRAFPGTARLDAYFNTILNVDTAYDDGSDDADVRCNVVIDDDGVFGAGHPRGDAHVTRYNYLYDAPAGSFVGSSNRSFGTGSASNAGSYCFWRRRWSNPQQVCIPLASTTAASPHVAAAANCNASLAEPFGLGPIHWPSATPCNDGVDDDGDGRIDMADPGCGSATAPREDPRCQNGLDDDGDGRIDFDGGRVANGGTALAAADPQCQSADQQSETGSRCGLGAEVSAALLALRGAARRMRRPRGRAA
jgi:hypothetical protein